MDTSKPMKVLLLEDDKNACKEFKDYIDTRDDIRLVASTDSTIVALKHVTTYMPEAIIVDIELDNGEGSGILFLEKLKVLELDINPIKIITTNIDSEVIDNYAHNGNADMIFHKKSNNYSIELVVENMIALRKAVYSINISGTKKNSNRETEDERIRRISNKINTELDLIGVGQQLIGRKYLYDALFYLLQEDNPGESVFYQLAKKYKKCNSAICRSMQTAIYRVWRTMPPDEIELHFTAKYDYQKGVPTPTEFLFYYKNKINKQLV